MEVPVGLLADLSEAVCPYRCRLPLDKRSFGVEPGAPSGVLERGASGLHLGLRDGLIGAGRSEPEESDQVEGGQGIHKVGVAAEVLVDDLDADGCGGASALLLAAGSGQFAPCGPYLGRPGGGAEGTSSLIGQGARKPRVPGSQAGSRGDRSPGRARGVGSRPRGPRVRRGRSPRRGIQGQAWRRRAR